MPARGRVDRVEAETDLAEPVAARWGGHDALDDQVARVEHQFTGGRINLVQFERHGTPQPAALEVCGHVEVEMACDVPVGVRVAVDIGPVAGVGGDGLGRRQRRGRRRSPGAAAPSAPTHSRSTPVPLPSGPCITKCRKRRQAPAPSARSEDRIRVLPCCSVLLGGHGYEFPRFAATHRYRLQGMHGRRNLGRDHRRRRTRGAERRTRARTLPPPRARVRRGRAAQPACQRTACLPDAGWPAPTEFLACAREPRSVTRACSCAAEP